ncbi:LOW QUALITY PROTEIN: hypothetical protein CFOL_v3_16300, partial [Cephalotus follicularis]
DKYYRYHHDHGHDTEECRHLKNQIEDLICKGHPRKYVDRNASQEWRECREEAPQPGKQQPRGMIHTISGGVTSGGDHNRGRKAYARQTFAVQQYQYNKRLKTSRDEEVISFSESDYEGVRLPHDNLVVVTLQVALFTMKRILIDMVSSTAPRQQVQMTFLVVDTLSPYNAIVGRPCLNLREAIVSTRHLVMKFSTWFGVREVRGDQQVARQ